MLVVGIVDGGKRLVVLLVGEGGVGWIGGHGAAMLVVREVREDVDSEQLGGSADW